MSTTDVASLRARSLRSGGRMVLTLAAVLFVSAGTLAYWQASAYVAFHSLFIGATTAYLLRTDPELVRRRLALDDAHVGRTMTKTSRPRSCATARRASSQCRSIRARSFVQTLGTRAR
jgi:hypothetical protein